MSGDPQDRFSDIHYDIYDAANYGWTEKFMKLAPYATRNDLEWCMEVVSNIEIAQYMCEKRGITNFITSGISTNRKRIQHLQKVIDYLEKQQAKKKII
jgi:hypothetical protein